MGLRKDIAITHLESRDHILKDGLWLKDIVTAHLPIYENNGRLWNSTRKKIFLISCPNSTPNPNSRQSLKARTHALVLLSQSTQRNILLNILADPNLVANPC